ncbi:MAG TPA: tripartite tricarboxylate transporter substrate binding protein, partial [Burkholderiales bacterium]|nr:tripartite tricarboxylate transporter substrate binding protein [Burkholderiales bacterium]
MNARLRLFAGVTFGVLAVAAGMARGAEPAAEYPNKPIRIIVASSPGTASDFFARSLGEELSAVYKQRVV